MSRKSPALPRNTHPSLQPSQAKRPALLQGASLALSGVLLCAASAGCQFIAGVDRSSLGETGGSGPTGITGVGGVLLGVGGMSGSAGSMNDASGGDLDASGIGGNDDGSAIGAGGAAGGTMGTGGAAGAMSGTGGTSLTGTGGMPGSGGAGGSVVIVDAGSDSGSTSPCVRALPAGWTLAVFSQTATSCPQGFADHPVFSGNATFGATACTCGCTTSQQGTCQGTLAVSVAPGQGVDTCSVTLTSGATVNGSNCIQAATPRVESALATFTGGGQGGACTDTPGMNPAQLTKPPAQHSCDVPAASSDAVCSGTPPTGFSSCVVGAANLTCPDPFTRVSYTVGDDMSLACATCTHCTVTTTCGAGTVNMFSDGNCATSVGSIAANGACNALSSSEVAVGSVQYAATATSACTGGRSTPSANLVAPRMICCR